MGVHGIQVAQHSPPLLSPCLVCRCPLVALPPAPSLSQSLQDHNDSLIARNVDLQKEVDKLPSMKKQLDAYKQAKCDAVRCACGCTVGGRATSKFIAAAGPLHITTHPRPNTHTRAIMAVTVR